MKAEITLKTSRTFKSFQTLASWCLQSAAQISAMGPSAAETRDRSDGYGGEKRVSGVSEPSGCGDAR